MTIFKLNTVILFVSHTSYLINWPLEKLHNVEATSVSVSVMLLGAGLGHLKSQFRGDEFHHSLWDPKSWRWMVKRWFSGLKKCRWFFFCGNPAIHFKGWKNNWVVLSFIFLEFSPRTLGKMNPFSAYFSDGWKKTTNQIKCGSAWLTWLRFGKTWNLTVECFAGGFRLAHSWKLKWRWLENQQNFS